ncbi:MAG: hypothetical protein HY558_01550 [Euryarchaeota archaeon]|nr:hypothetical protein [Euryarchaeota archaeon]
MANDLRADIEALLGTVYKNKKTLGEAMAPYPGKVLVFQPTPGKAITAALTPKRWRLTEGDCPSPDGTLRGPPEALRAILKGEGKITEMVREGKVELLGNYHDFRVLLELRREKA